MIDRDPRARETFALGAVIAVLLGVIAGGFAHTWIERTQSCQAHEVAVR